MQPSRLVVVWLFLFQKAKQPEVADSCRFPFVAVEDIVHYAHLGYFS